VLFKTNAVKSWLLKFWFFLELYIFKSTTCLSRRLAFKYALFVICLLMWRQQWRKRKALSKQSGHMIRRLTLDRDTSFYVENSAKNGRGGAFPCIGSKVGEPGGGVASARSHWSVSKRGNSNGGERSLTAAGSVLVCRPRMGPLGPSGRAPGPIGAT
jgi:hypothetical protein